MNSVYKSFQYLANKNNGLFVSKKQAEFLKNVLIKKSIEQYIEARDNNGKDEETGVRDITKKGVQSHVNRLKRMGITPSMTDEEARLQAKKYLDSLKGA